MPSKHGLKRLVYWPVSRGSTQPLLDDRIIVSGSPLDLRLSTHRAQARSKVIDAQNTSELQEPYLP